MAETVRTRDKADDAVVIWRPRSRPQAALIACPVFEVFFGGSRGSLKTDSMLGDWINQSALYGADSIGLMVRRTRTELSETYERAKAVFLPLGFKFNDSDHIVRSPDGSRLKFAYLDNDSDAEKYQGHSYTRVYGEELGNFPTPVPILKLMATLRSAKGIPCGFRGTGNPGGPGHQWVKARYIDDDPLGWKVRQFEFINPFTKEKITRDRVFIPGRITDHDLLGPEYVANLMMSGSEELVRAWLEGDWDVILGAFFDCWRSSQHVIKPFEVPDWWTRFTSFDWGSFSPFSHGWWAVSDGSVLADGRSYPAGAMIRYREWYGAKSTTEGIVGLKMNNEDVAAGILARETKAETKAIRYRVADPSIFNTLGGPSIAEVMSRAGVSFSPADNRRVPKKGAISGWSQLRDRLLGDDAPMIYCFDTCTDSIRTIPMMQHDKLNPEDVDTESEDHAADEWRYACMSRPYARVKPTPPRDIAAPATLNELMNLHFKHASNEKSEWV